MDVTVSTLGAISALVIAILLILKKVPPAYGMVENISFSRSSHDSCWRYRTGSFAAWKLFPCNRRKRQYGYERTIEANAI